VSQKLQQDAAEKVDLIARQLLASLFYFQVTKIDSLNKDEDYCHGLICCRLSPACTAQNGVLDPNCTEFQAL
jgi:hypothetical protein